MEKMQKMEIKIQQAAEGMIYIGMSIVFELQMQPLFNAIIVFWGDIYWDLFHLLFFCWETIVTTSSLSSLLLSDTKY